MARSDRKKAGKGSRQSEQRISSTLLTFSFKYYNPIDGQWCLSSLEGTAQIYQALQALKAVSQLTLGELMQQSSVWHFHPVDFARSTQPNGFGVTALEEAEAFQFSLIGVNNQRCRAVGAYQNSVFYIVWFDTEHQLFPSKKKHT